MAIHVDQGIKGAKIVETPERLRLLEMGKPKKIHVDNSSELISKDLDRWAYEQSVELVFSRPGKPTDNPYIESFNGSFRDECLNTNWFLSLDDAKDKIQAWREKDNTFRPHSCLGDLASEMFLKNQVNKTEFSNFGLLGIWEKVNITYLLPKKICLTNF